MDWTARPESIGTGGRNHWNTHTEAPLRQALAAAEIQEVRCDFDTLVRTIARPVLRRPFCSTRTPVLVEDLVRWRADYFREEFMRDHVTTHALRAERRPIARRDSEDRIREYCASSFRLAVVVGRSGVGKSLLGIRLSEWMQRDIRQFVMLVDARTLDSPELDTHLTRMLGGLGSEGPLAMSELERWLIERKQRMLVFVDALNEFGPLFDDCLKFFRNILRVALFLRPRSPIRIVVSVRDETWRRLASHVDHAQLVSTLWGEVQTDGAIQTIQLDGFTDGELDEALQTAAPTWLKNGAVWPSFRDRLRDPFLFGVLSESPDTGAAQPLASRAFDWCMQERLSRCSLTEHPAILTEVLAKVATTILEAGRYEFRLRESCELDVGGELTRMFIDAGLVSPPYSHRFDLPA